jgi:hypothetical protein
MGLLLQHGVALPLPACGERSDREAIRVRGPFRESEPQILRLRIVEKPPLPARGEREKEPRCVHVVTL